MFAPFVLEAFAVLIEHRVARFVEIDHFSRSTEYLFHFASVQSHAVEFCHGSCREKCAGCRVLNGGREQHFFAVVGECPWRFACRMAGEACGRSSFCRHDEDVGVAVAVAGKGYLLAVGRPYWRTFVGFLCCKSHGLSSFCRHFIDVALIGENNLAAIGRNLHVAHPERSSCTGRQGCQSERNACESFLHWWFLF